MRSRAEEYLESQRLADLAVSVMASPELPPLGDRALTAELYLRAALVSATNAGAGPGVEHDARALEQRQAAEARPKPGPPVVRL